MSVSQTINSYGYILNKCVYQMAAEQNGYRIFISETLKVAN